MKIIRFFFILIIVFILVCLVMNQSIFSYIEQKYHFAFYPKNDILQEANGFKNKLEQIRAILSNEPLPQNIEENIMVQEDMDELNASNDFIDKNTTIEDIQQTEDENVSFIDNTKLEVHKGDEFLFIGDSLMQGVAIALNRDLIDLGLKANDLSKQNTGLSYKSYFDWAKATKEAFAKNPNIKYLVVLLGANDPWDIKKGGVYHRFGSDSWIDIYTYRVNEIINIAKQHHAKILWFEIPPVKKNELNEKIQILNKIYSEEILKNKQIFINTKLFFSANDEFSTYIKNENNKSIKMRTDDGIHFTSNGAKEMSKLLLQHITIKEENAN
ncbi:MULTISPECIES: SGNH/GDSL hydrolase family protein [Campylobacter]|uniref:SGNH/GDSL hydrolase family protein n=1 Tax=Campylobacter TaxID=194 RepID=UPI000763F2D7|nr:MULTISPECIES: GDSL-type esterase/lipase family protein [Campylobacter]MCE7085620.1 GDSL-type esterase/lipase family protein [Campylobacter coli]MCE7090854.1 GDSL-type esterase/lipase family protein [Campylobacter coli]MCE7134088.1 GDSL-type esterase/lipase family protein [Campylobacter coli]MCE7149549.1 GDSL-type esterase/lipase family protein [Campylobacter coli]MCE7156621.1 GDSL-type esterase/lipase family protein [Campylobacter coli]